MKKKFFLAVFILIISNSVTIAQNLDITNKNDVPVIMPTINNLITLCDLSESNFKSTMQRYNYIRDKGFEVNPFSICYSNGIDGFLYECANNITYSNENNYVFVMLSINKDMIYPVNSLSNLLDKLKPYYLKSSGNEYYYSYDNYNLILEYSNNLVLIYCWRKQI